MCGSADPTVAIVALLHAMAAVLTESAKQEVDQVPFETVRLTTSLPVVARRSWQFMCLDVTLSLLLLELRSMR